MKFVITVEVLDDAIEFPHQNNNSGIGALAGV